MKYALMIDINRCSVCYSCQVACKDEFMGNVYPPYSDIQTDREPAWINVLETEKGKYPYVKVYPTPVLCMHCDDAPCMKACPISGCIYKNDFGAVIIDPTKCNGCKACVEACPYGVIVFNDDKNICQKCTLCSHKLAEGKEPACIDACPSNVFHLGEESEIKALAEKRGAKWMNPEYNTKPRVYYVGLPSLSLAGHVLGAKSLMDIPDASVTITGDKADAKISQKTNIAGNFLITDLTKDSKYTVTIECQGYKPVTIKDVSIDIEFKHLGEIKMEKA